MLHVVVFGPPGCGKTYLCKNLSKIHKRQVINMNELVDWHI